MLAQRDLTMQPSSALPVQKAWLGNSTGTAYHGLELAAGLVKLPDTYEGVLAPAEEHAVGCSQRQGLPLHS